MNDETSLAWFHRLSMNDKVQLMRDPHGALPARLAVSLSKAADNPGVTTNGYFPATGQPTGLHVAPSEAAKVEAQRDQLQWWWERVPSDDRTYLVDHRAEELPAAYGPLVRSASDVGDNPALVVVTVSDNKTGRFRLPPMVYVFVEMQARQRHAAESGH